MINHSRILAAAAIAVVFTACSNEEEPRGTAITDVTVIDAGGVRENQTVVFDGDEILAVQSADAPLSPVENTIDGAGRYLIPGLWDMHVHLTYDDAFTADMPAMFLQHGITSVRDTGGLLHRLKPVIDGMRAPGFIAPRAYYSGPLLDGEFVVYDGESRPEIGTQNATEAMARENVAALKAAGADFIKIYEMVSPDVFYTLAGVAAEYEMPIAAHVPLSMLARQAGPNVDSMEHLRNVELDCASTAPTLFEERRSILAAHEEGPGFELRSRLHTLQRLPAIAAFDEDRCAETIASLRSTIQVPTLRLNTFASHPVYERPDWNEVLDKLPAAADAEWRAATSEWRTRDMSAPPTDPTFGLWSLALVGRMHAAGVPIGAGTDTPIGRALPGDSLHTELERLVDAGLSPLDALVSATVRPAEFLGLEDEMGRIEPGMRADLVLLAEDPLANISATRGVQAVVTAGRYLDRPALDALPALEFAYPADR